MKYGLLLTFLFAAFGCRPASTTSDQVSTNDASIISENHPEAVSETTPWVNRVWIKNDTNDLPGELRIFLADGTLLMDSCWETYRLTNWERRSDSVVVWREDTAEIEAHLEMVGPKELQVRLMLAGDTVVEQYQGADAPYVCPEMQR